MNGFVNKSVFARLHRAAQRTHHAGGESALESERIADGEHALADQQIAGIAEGQRRNFAPGEINLNQCNVVVRIGADQFSFVTRLIAQSDFDSLGALHDVEVRQNVAVVVHQKA